MSRLNEEQTRTLGNMLRKRSLWVLLYATGCGVFELPPIITSRYDMERFGMVPYATPRQADILIVTGYVNVKTLRRLITVYEQMLDPKYVVALGSCPINGGIYWDSYAVIKQVDRYIPVDVYIAGCMPAPEAIFAGVGHLMELIDKGEATGYKRYKENLEHYKKNQRKVLEWQV